MRQSDGYAQQGSFRGARTGRRLLTKSAMAAPTGSTPEYRHACSSGFIADYSRLSDHLDQEALARVHLTCVGVGGASTLIQNLARVGILRFRLIDLDTVSSTNIATQNYFARQIGKPKVAALAANLKRINPTVAVTTIVGRYEELSERRRKHLWESTSIVLAMTDSHAAQMAINRDAIRHGKDAIFAMMGDGLRQMEVTATFPEVVARGGGCHACQVWPRVKAYREGFTNPAVIGSHVVSADMLNAQLAYLVLARLHQKAGADKPIVKIADRFSASPCLLTQLDPSLWSSQPESYGVIPAGMELFTTKLFGLDTPKGWMCEACGTEGVA